MQKNQACTNRFVLRGAGADAVLHRPVLGKSTEGKEETKRATLLPPAWDGKSGRSEGTETKEKRQARRKRTQIIARGRRQTGFQDGTLLRAGWFC